MAIKFLSGLNLSNVTAGSILKLDSNGNIVAAVDGTDYNTSSSLWSTAGTGGVNINKDVRIGTFSSDVLPEARLHVYAYQTTDPKLLIEDGNTGDASMEFKISTQSYTMGIDNSDSDKFILAASSALGTTNVFTVNTSGNVTFVDTVYNQGTIKTKNSSYGVLSAYGSEGFSYEPLESNNSQIRYWLRFDYTNNASYPYLTNRTPNGAVVIKTGTAAGAGENEHFRIKGGDGTVDAYFTNANVGIGVSSPPTDLSLGNGTHTSPDDTDRILNWYSATGGDEISNTSHYITVGQGSSDTTQPKSVGLALFNQNTANNTYSPAITFGGLSTSGNYMNGAAAIAAQLISNTNDNNFRSGELTFYTQGTTTATRGLTERMRIDGSGNVGIGTSNPSAKLEVAYNGSNGSSGLSDYGFVVTTSNGTDQPTLGAESTGDGYANLNLGSNIDGTRRFWHISKRKATDSHKLSFYYYNGTSFSEPFQFRTNGDFFANTVYSPTIRVSGTNDHLTLRSDIQVDQGSTDPIIEFKYGTTQMGKFDQDGYMYATGFKTTTASTGLLKADGTVDTTTLGTMASESASDYKDSDAVETYVGLELASYTLTSAFGSNAFTSYTDHSTQNYLTSYTETDTLDSVTGRGATTTNNISIGNLTAVGGAFTDPVTIYDSLASENPRLSVGRNAGESIQFDVTDVVNTITAKQDSDSDGDHTFVLDRVFAGAGDSIFTIQNDGTPDLTIDGSGVVSFNQYNTAGILKVNTSGTISVDTSSYLTSYTETSTLDNVADRGATTNQALTLGSSATSGGRILSANYTGSNRLGVISSEYSSGDLLLGYGAEGKNGSAGFVSTYGNFSGAHSVLQVASSSLDWRVDASNSQTEIGSDLTLASQFAVSRTGILTMGDGFTSTKGNTAHGWGNHASAGYLTTSTAATTYAPLASPALTGTPTAPTAAAATNTTQVATTAFVTTAVSNLVDSSPAALNTLNELAAALGDDASFSTTMSTALGNRLRIDVNNQSLSSTELANARTNLGLGTAATSAATSFVAVSGDTMTGNLTMSSATPTLKFSINGAENNAGIVWEDGDAGDPSAQAAAIKWDASSNHMRFYNNDEAAERMRINSDGTTTFLGTINASAGIGGLTLANGGISGSNYNITGVNQLEIADPGEGIVFKSGSSGDMTLAIVDDTSDNILRFSGTNATFDVAGSLTSTNITIADGIYHEGDGNTFLNFGTDTINLNTGGGSRINITNSNIKVNNDLIVAGGETFSLGERAEGDDNGRTVLIEGVAAASSGEGSGRIFFTEHNSTDAAADKYGLSLYYEGNGNAQLPSGCQPNTGNATWSLRRHDNSVNGAAIMSGTRSSNNVTFSGTVTVAGRLYATTVDANATSTTALVLGASNEIEKRTLGTNAFNSTAYLEDISPATPSVSSATVVGETIEIAFAQSSTPDVDYYQVWSAVGSGGSYGMIAHVPQEDVASSMTVIDATFDVSDTIYYRVYAVKSGIYSTAGTINRAFSSAALDVSNMSVVNLNTAYYIQYEMPDSRFVDHVEIYMDAEASAANLTRTGATLVYSGNNTSYMYKIGANDLDKYHQFWVEVVES